MAVGRKRSKKQSAANCKSRQPEKLTIFIDRSLGRKIGNILSGASGVEVIIHDDLFPPDCPDHDWLKEAGRRGWIVFTKDRRIRHRSIELNAIRQARVYAFILRGKDMTGEEMGQAFKKALNRIRKTLKKHNPPLIATVSRSGIIRLLDE
ncbi:hypothetical protein ACFL35_03870 [Candidatus Riflebacteria bacterium]